eukprot:TRINITY_DN121517_c0_g1_i1.p1 TRINITY_DN121517_c0_g1~~TRINITY_DN121517_c0_g1_i1.p1  ORF type:complete len:522 (+),score=69.69 TRINITY_DN121517_c0_g1_i1:67-1566(+)
MAQPSRRRSARAASRSILLLPVACVLLWTISARGLSAFTTASPLRTTVRGTRRTILCQAKTASASQDDTLDAVDTGNTTAPNDPVEPVPVGRREAMRESAVDSVMSFVKPIWPVFALVAAYIVAKVASVGQPIIPALEGPFKKIGSSVKTLGGIRCRIFYPTEDTAQGKEAPYLTDGKNAPIDTIAGLVLLPGFFLEHLQTATSGCVQDAPARKPETPFPVIVFSHGQGCNMDIGTFYMRQLASFGNVIVMPEHRDGSASTNDKENPRPFHGGLFDFSEEGQLPTKDRAKELVDVAEALKSEASAYGGNVSKLLVGGHSYGGPTAVLAASERSDLFKGILLHDPAVSGLADRQLEQPLFATLGDSYASFAPVVEDLRKLSAGRESKDEPKGFSWTGIWHYEGVHHANFMDAGFWLPNIFMQVLPPLCGGIALDSAMRSRAAYLVEAQGPLATVLGSADPAQVHVSMSRAASAFARAVLGAAPLSDRDLPTQAPASLKRV